MNVSNNPRSPARVAPNLTQISLKKSLAEIDRLHSEIISAARKTINDAIRIGELLTDAKGKLSHGEWLPWVENNLPFDRATAANYMRVFDRRSELKCKNLLHLSDAYQLLQGPPRPKLTPPPATYSDEQIQSVAEVVEFAASGMARRVTEDECLTLGLLLLANRLRINDELQGEVFLDGEWKPFVSYVDEGGAK